MLVRLCDRVLYIVREIGAITNKDDYIFKPYRKGKECVSDTRRLNKLLRNTLVVY